MSLYKVYMVVLRVHMTEDMMSKPKSEGSIRIN